ncbi:MAG: sulfide-dependent adenosine diphosphate thiazole synthase [Lentisphaeria bacterium]|nr:sulfide-dependent adenosine diphosphate thiazole synthase [Lentisphaeria bacterium]
MENIITTAIIRQFADKLSDSIELDVAFVGGGPSALVAAAELAQQGLKTAIFEKSLAPGGGVWGGGMLFNEIVVQENVLSALGRYGIRTQPVPGAPGYFTVDSVEMASGLIFHALKAGARIFNAMAVEDIVFKDGRVNGLVINWAPVRKLAMPVDPLTIVAKAVVDATGHPCEIIRVACDKAQVKISTETGGVLGEKPMWVENGEQQTVDSTAEYFPGLFACGMSATNVTGGYRMGPIFGGMILSGLKAAQLIAASLAKLDVSP